MERDAARCDQTIYQRAFSINRYVRRPAFDEHEETLHRHWRSFSILIRRSMIRQDLEPRSLWQLEKCFSVQTRMRPAFDLRKELEVVALAARNSSYLSSRGYI